MVSVPTRGSASAAHPRSPSPASGSPLRPRRAAPATSTPSRRRPPSPGARLHGSMVEPGDAACSKGEPYPTSFMSHADPRRPGWSSVVAPNGSSKAAACASKAVCCAGDSDACSCASSCAGSCDASPAPGCADCSKEERSVRCCGDSDNACSSAMSAAEPRRPSPDSEARDMGSPAPLTMLLAPLRAYAELKSESGAERRVIRVLAARRTRGESKGGHCRGSSTCA
mmetsp:Transcript_135/g.398  ORF Transcript_135/g.398 Transcript_135/m.398 type:complete len:226 (+) Transcript_135:1315-1992(+)